MNKRQRNFNPRSREGSDGTDLSDYRENANFNPRSREGSDPVRRAVVSSECEFQSTLP